MRASLAVLALILAGCTSSDTIDETTTNGPDGVAYSATMHRVGHSAFEPTLGVTSDGTIFFAATDRGVAIGYKPIVLRSQDGGATWQDVSPRLAGQASAPPETNDPFLYVDPGTDRVFHFPMAPILTCSVISWSDNGGDAWVSNPRGCGNPPPWDHQAMVAAKPRTVPTVGYDNVLVQCVNNIAMSSCSRSLDGGWTWTTGTSPFPTPQCNGGLHGHPVAAPDGTVYLPKNECAKQEVAVSRDDGLTWTRVVASTTKGHDWPDPAMAVDAGGNVYYSFIGPKGELLFTYSTDGGSTWSETFDVGPAGVTAHLPAMAAGDNGTVVLAFPGTPDLPAGYGSSSEEAKKALWYGYFLVLRDATGNRTSETIRLDDALVRGVCGPQRCPGMTDFIDVVIGADGRAYASFVDMCSNQCQINGTNDGQEGIVAILESSKPFVTIQA